MPVDFRKRTFFETVARASREPVYSAAFAWLFTEQSPLSLAQRVALVESLIDDTASGLSITADAESDFVDILLTVERAAGPLHVAIENKIKSSESESQLAKYDAHLAGFRDVKKLFLSVNGEAPRSGMGSGWQTVSYSRFLDAIRAVLSLQTPGVATLGCVKDLGYVEDVCSAMERLVGLSNAAGTDQGHITSRAFKDPGATGSDMASYMEDMRLHMLVQRMWIGNLIRALDVKPPWKCSLKEHHGQAILDVKAAFLNPPDFALGLQLQNRTLKLFCSPDPYSPTATAEQQNTVAIMLDECRGTLGLEPERPMSASRGRGFRSLRISTMPDNRQLEDWLPILRVQVHQIQAAFPQVAAPKTW
jgi:hypothetical protein